MNPDLGFTHYWLDKGSKRTLLLLHGTGGDEKDLGPLGEALDAGANLLSPRGRISEGGANRFFRRFAEGVFDEPNLIQEAYALSEFVIASSALYTLDGLVAVGFSNGANMAAALLLLHPRVLAGAIMIRAMVPIVPTTAPNLEGGRALILSGDQDQMIPLDSAYQLATMLKTYGAEVDHEVLHAGHGLTREDVDLAKGWLANS